MCWCVYSKLKMYPARTCWNLQSWFWFSFRNSKVLAWYFSNGQNFSMVNILYEMKQLLCNPEHQQKRNCFLTTLKLTNYISCFSCDFSISLSPFRTERLHCRRSVVSDNAFWINVILISWKLQSRNCWCSIIKVESLRTLLSVPLVLFQISLQALYLPGL